MKFTKTAIAIAVAGFATAAPMIVSADTTLSGAVQLQIRGTDAEGDAGDARIGTGDVLVGVSTSHELNNGLTGYGSLRIDLDRLSNDGATVVTNDPATEDDDQRLGSAGTADSVFVGIKGGFGDIRIGEVPNAVEYGQLSNDIFDVAGEVNGGISYSGSFGPASIIAQFSPEQNSDVVGVGAKFNIGGFAIGLGAEDRADLANAAAGVSFAYSGAAVSAHFHTREQAAGDDLESFAVKVGFGIAGASAAVTYTVEEAGTTIDNDAVRLDIGYDLGGGMDISTRIQANNNNVANTDDSAWRIQLSKTF